jgi:CDP-diacylglycerol--glycerol-3-phosphate 3-phosphatidyltransferase
MSGILNLANSLSLVRILFAFIATYLIMTKDITLVMFAIILIAYSELTDMLDGYIARRDGLVSDIGKLLDPLSDSISRFLFFFAFGYIGLFPLWIVLALFVRDIIVAYIRTYISLSGIALGARFSGKLKAIVQFIGQYLLIFSLVIYLRQSGQELGETRLYTLIALGTISTIAILYFLKIRGRYLKYSILGYTSFLIPFYLVNTINPPNSTLETFNIATISIVALVTIYSLYDYIVGFIENLKANINNK